jgi:hypothetical protein
MGGGCTLGPRGGKAWVGERAGWVGGGGGAGAARARARTLTALVYCMLIARACAAVGWLVLGVLIKDEGDTSTSPPTNTWP